MKKLTIATIALLVATASTAVPVAAQVLNGSFESPGCAPTAFCTNAFPTSWQVFGGIDIVNTYWQAGDGSISLDLNGTTQGGVGQTLTGLTVGATYDLSFLLSKNPLAAAATLDVLWLDPPPVNEFAFFTAPLGTTFTFSTPNSVTAMMWSQRTLQLTATSTTMFLGFRSNEIISVAGPALDRVSLLQSSAVPEPGTYALMASGLVALAAMRRRRGR